jgi:hypothetical protein
MADENTELIQAQKEEIYEVIHGWYMSNWGCKGLNNDEIKDEISGLLNDAGELECTCSDCNVDIVEKYLLLLRNREKHTPYELKQKEFSLSMVINCLGHFSEVDNVCPCCAIHRLKDLFEAYYWLGVLIGAERERSDYGVSAKLKNADNKRHSHNRERKLEIAEWWRINKGNYKSRDEGAASVAHKFNLSYGTARKHLVGR